MHIVAIEGFAGSDVSRFPHARVGLGQLGRLLASFEQAGVRDLVIAGAMQRPNLLQLKIDFGFLRHLPTILSLTRGGDDSVLRRVVTFFEAQGFRVLGAGEVAPGLLAPEGMLGRIEATAGQGRAMQRAARLIRDLGPFDVGQAVVAGEGGIIAVEGVRGTDAMLGDLGPGAAGAGRATGAVLVKLAKPGQELRVDLPTIGPQTVRRAEAAGLAGIAVGAARAIVLERQRVIAEADAAGLFAMGLQPDGGTPRYLPEAPEAPLRLFGRRAPTPADRRDVVIGRQLMPVLRQHGAGHAALVAREHVLAIATGRPVAELLAQSGRPPSWGRQVLRSRLGVVLIDAGASDAHEVLTADLFRGALQSRVAGIVWLGRLPPGERRAEIEAWAGEAGVFLMGEADASEGSGP